MSAGRDNFALEIKGLHCEEESSLLFGERGKIVIMIKLLKENGLNWNLFSEGGLLIIKSLLLKGYDGCL